MNNNHQKQFKSQKIFLHFTLLSILLLSRNALEENQNIDKVFVNLNQDFSILPHDHTRDTICDKNLLENTYGTIAFSFLKIFKEPESFKLVEKFKDNLKNVQKETLDLAEKMQQFINLRIQPKEILSPTFYTKNQFKNEKDQILFKIYPEVDVLSQKFLDRLQMDKEIYMFTKKIELIVKKLQNFDQSFINTEREIFLKEVAPMFEWIGGQYIPKLYGLNTIEEVLNNKDQFTVKQYRFWNIRKYREIDSNDLIDNEILINQLQSYTDESKKKEIQVYACDLYAAMIFEFQCLIKSDSVNLDKQLEADMSLFRIIHEKFYTEEKIYNTQICKIAIPPQDYFFKYIIKLDVFQKINNKIWQTQHKINFEYILDFLQSQITNHFTEDNYTQDRYFFDLDIYIIEHLLKRTVEKNLNMQEMKTIYFFITDYQKKLEFKDKTNVDDIFSITIQFLNYLSTTYKNQKLRETITEEGIIKSLKMQYLIFTFLRLEALKKNDYSIFKSYDIFIKYFVEIFNRKLEVKEKDYLIRHIGEQYYYSSILVTLEIITITEIITVSYKETIYKTIGETMKNVIVQDFIPGENLEIILQKVETYKPITDKDFTPPRIIFRVFIEQQIEQMLDFLNQKFVDVEHTSIIKENQIFEKLENEIQQNKISQNYSHLLEKKFFYQTLVDIIHQTEKYTQTQQQNQKVTLEQIIRHVQDNQTNANKQIKIDWKFVLEQAQIKDKQKNFNIIEIQSNVYQHLYQYTSEIIQNQIQLQQHSLDFLSFIELYQEQDQVKFLRETNQTSDSQSSSTLQIFFLFKDKIQEICDYNDKWNETLFADSVFLYPWILVKHRDQIFGKQNPDECKYYDPSVLTKEEAIFFQKSGLEKDQVEYCINQRSEKFQKMLLDESDLQQTQMSQIEYIQNIALSPELYIFLEQFQFMIDSFEIFKIFKKINGNRIMTDKTINKIYFNIYRFIIQIRSSPTFVYGHDLWGTIFQYLEECMLYQRFSQDSKTKYFCDLGYAKYNEMYWFLKNTHYEATENFSILENAFKNQKLTQIQQADYKISEVNWGDRTHGRFRYFTHYLLRTRIFQNYNSEDEELKEFNKNNNYKLIVWDECYSNVKNKNKDTIDFCKYLIYVSEIYNQFKDIEPTKDYYEVLLNILSEIGKRDSDKIIAWEVLDFFQFEQDIGNFEIIETIREIFDSKVIERIQKNTQSPTISELLDINDKKIIAEYAMSKYDEHTTIGNIHQHQQIKDSFKKNILLRDIVKQILSSTENIQKFLELKQSQINDEIFNNIKIIHHIPLSLLLYYASNIQEFEKIAQVLHSIKRLELLFLGDIKAGEIIIDAFEQFIKYEIINKTKDIEQVSYIKLVQFITRVQQQITDNKIIQPVMKESLPSYTASKQLKSSLNLEKFSLRAKKTNNQNTIQNLKDTKILWISEEISQDKMETIPENVLQEIKEESSFDELEYQLKKKINNNPKSQNNMLKSLKENFHHSQNQTSNSQNIKNKEKNQSESSKGGNQYQEEFSLIKNLENSVNLTSYKSAKEQTETSQIKQIKISSSTSEEKMTIKQISQIKTAIYNVDGNKLHLIKTQKISKLKEFKLI